MPPGQSATAPLLGGSFFFPASCDNFVCGSGADGTTAPLPLTINGVATSLMVTYHTGDGPGSAGLNLRAANATAALPGCRTVTVQTAPVSAESFGAFGAVPVHVSATFSLVCTATPAPAAPTGGP